MNTNNVCTMKKIHSKAIICSMCGGQFFPDSLKFHQKSCAKKQKYVMLPCPFCDEEISKPELINHVDSCKKNPNIKRLQKRNSGETNEDVCENLIDEEGRMKCVVCNRRFAQDRIAVHQRICKQNNERSSRGVFNSFKQRQFDNLVQPSEIAQKKNIGANTAQNKATTINDSKGKEENVVKFFGGTKKIDKKKLDVHTAGKISTSSRKQKNEPFHIPSKNSSYSSLGKDRNGTKFSKGFGEILPTNECSPDNTLAFPLYPHEPSNTIQTHFQSTIAPKFVRNDNAQTFVDGRKILKTNETSYNNPMYYR